MGVTRAHGSAPPSASERGSGQPPPCKGTELWQVCSSGHGRPQPGVCGPRHLVPRAVTHRTAPFRHPVPSWHPSSLGRATLHGPPPTAPQPARPGACGPHRAAHHRPPGLHGHTSTSLPVCQSPRGPCASYPPTSWCALAPSDCPAVPRPGPLLPASPRPPWLAADPPPGQPCPSCPPPPARRPPA